MESPRSTRKSPRVAIAAALATGTVMVFAALGGVGVAQSAISSAQYAYGKNKVTVCHKGHTIKIAQPAVAAHVRHGDTLGTCAAAKAKKAKAAKAKAAKAKAAKAKAAKAKAAKAKAVKAEKSQAGANPGKGKGKGK